MDDGASSTGDAFGVGERFAFPEVDGVSMSWNDDFRRERSPGVAEHYLLRVRRGADSSADVRPGTALSASGVARRLAARPKRGRGLYMLALALGFNALEACSCSPRFARS